MLALKSLYDRFQVPWVRYFSLLILDGAITYAAFFTAYQLRFDGILPPRDLATLLDLAPILVGSRLTCSLLFQLHRWTFRFSGFGDAVRLATATVMGTGLFLALIYMWGVSTPPRSVVVMEFFVSTALIGASRFSPRMARTWWMGVKRSKRTGQVRTIIVGAGSAGELLMRDLQQSEEHSYRIVGFVDDDRRKWGSLLAGQPVLGGIDDLPAVVKRLEVDKILIAIPRLEPARVREILNQCRDMKVQYKILPVSFTYLQDRVSASMLQDLTPEDLLPRDTVAFKEEDIRALITGRSVLVTGAAGSIGSEIARQVAQYGARALALCDINENDLYFLFRDLRVAHPELELHAEVLDIRDRDRVLHLGLKHKPALVFHAAAHKHVPLMETAPSEAVKNNILGTLNVADMADRVQAASCVYISTDKAVNPTSVMGASKRVGEFLVRDLARRSQTRFTAVRFGNVLGSAGSVVPLFKQQIAKRGPVTVTHPEMKRYFMTIPEAVGLVLLAGLGGYGELCILDMGEPFKILDLARHMISMAGLVPDVDVPIQITGLRQGEKLYEDLMTEGEENTQEVRSKIFSVRCPPPPHNLHACVAKLTAAAGDQGDEKVVELLQELIPTYTPQRNNPPKMGEIAQLVPRPSA